MRKRTRAITLVLIPVLGAVGGCSYDPNDSDGQTSRQRDVYTKFEDCVADWGKPELCQQIAEAEARQFQQATTGSTGGTHQIIYFGPDYYGGTRSVSYNGQAYTPSANRAMSKPFVLTPSSSNFARTSPATPARPAVSSSAARGGFGAAGRAASVGSSGG